MMSEKILFVDDEPNVLNAIKRQLRKKFQLATATSGREGLEIIQKEGPFSVVVSDMKMPEMNGIAFLKKVQEIAPDTVRLMLTGNADQQTAIDAVNEGNVFRFMSKPCQLGPLLNTLEAAQNQYKLINAEREVLEGTLNGSIKLLLEVLSIAAPTISGRAIALRETAIEVARALQITNTWEMEMATMLSHIAHITLPPETLTKTISGEPLSKVEQRIINHLPETGYKLLAHIPRLKNVAKIVLFQNKNFDGSGIPSHEVAGEEIPIESRILKVLFDLKEQEEDKELPTDQALELMLQKNNNRYDPRVLETVACFLSNKESENKATMSAATEAMIMSLQPGQVLLSNVETEDGKLLFTAGHVLSGAIVEKLINYHQVHKIKEPIQVSIPMK